MQIREIGDAALLASLSGGGAVTVVTPNARLARALQADFDRDRLLSGARAWEAPDILPFAAFLARCHAQAAYADPGSALPILLTDAEARLVWEEVIAASRWRDGLLSLASTAALAAEGWELAHAWGIEGAIGAWPGDEDAEAFAAWCAQYRRRTEAGRLVDAARLPPLVAGLIGRAVPAPALLVLHGFDIVTPQLRAFLAACAGAGVEARRSAPARAHGAARRVELASPAQELAWAARWARARLEASAPGRPPRIGIVLPDLAQRRAEAARVFARVLGDGAGGAPLYNLSLGEPLAAVPLVEAASGLLELALGSVAFERVSRLLRAPFLAGGESERGERARLDAALRRVAPADLPLARLRALAAAACARAGAPACAGLQRALERLAAEAARVPRRAPPHEWARRFTAMLDAAGFPGERALDSAEFQALAKWREALGALAAMGAVAGPWDAHEARSRLHRLCADTVFQPATGAAPVQVLGMLESAGLAFDHLWVCGMTEEAWPLPARAHPLIPPALQRKAGIPQASPEASLALDRALTAAWREAAPEVVFSSPRRDGDRELLASPLVAPVARVDPAVLALPEFTPRAEALHAAARRAGGVRNREETPAPPLEGERVAGGTAILADQAACPFRAFAHFRLDARALERPQPGLGPAQRGQLLHAMMARLWAALDDQATLRATPPAQLAAKAGEAAAHAVARVAADHPGRLEGRFAALERERLAALALAWLAIEKDRAPFTVRMHEEKVALEAGGLRLAGRVDRVDRLEDGGLAVIDYKSGAVSVSAWLGERPDDAQLPLYALAAGGETVRAVAFARLRTGQLGFVGLAADAAALPGVGTVEESRSARRHADSWAALRAIWRAQVDRLGAEFAQGEARVDPKRQLATCRLCDLRTLCRVHERLGALAEGEGEGAEADEA